MQSMSEFSQVWLEFINGKVPIESVLEEIGKSGYDCTQDVPWSLYWKELFEANGPDTKVILTVRDSTEKWWTSFLKFFTQEIMRADFWGFNTMNLMTNLCKTGLAGSAMKRMMELDYIVTCRFYHESFYTKTYSTEKVLKAIESAKETVCKRYEEHNELVQKTIPKENLLVWNLKEGWEPLCKFLDVPIPDVPVPRENVTGDLGWSKEYFYQDQVTRNGFIYLICNSILMILAICLAIYLPLKYA